MIVLEVQWLQAICLMCEVILRVGLQWGPRQKKLQKGGIHFIGQEQDFGPMEFILGPGSKALEKCYVTSLVVVYQWYKKNKRTSCLGAKGLPLVGEEIRKKLARMLDK